MQAPSHNPVTLVFGATTDPYSAANSHKGIDFAYTPDSTIYMPCDAVITQKPNNGADGNGTYFTAPDGTFQGLLHADHYLVPNGASVKEGQPVAVMGDTGFAQGKHLHWAVMKDGRYIDPLTLLSGGSGGVGEIDMIPDIAHLDAMFQRFFGRNSAPDEQATWINKKTYTELIDVFETQQAYKEQVHISEVGYVAVRDDWQGQINALNKQLAEQGTILKPGKYVVK